MLLLFIKIILLFRCQIGVFFYAVTVFRHFDSCLSHDDLKIPDHMPEMTLTIEHSF